MALDGLTNPLTQLNILDDEMKWRGNWTATTQYFKNDVVRSPLNGIEYILGSKTATRGGLDPGDPANTTAEWTQLGGIASSSLAPVFVDGGPPNYTITNGSLTLAPAGSRWLINFYGTKTLAVGNNAATDVDTITWTATGGDTATVDILPQLAAPASGDTGFSISCVLQTVGAGPITMTGEYFGTIANYVGKVSYIRLA
jgi:hypothetical protein